MARALAELADAEARAIRPPEVNATALWPTAAGFVSAGPIPVATSPSPTRAVFRAAPRAYLLVGPQATPRGVAKRARELLFPVGAPAAPAAVAAANDEVLGAALFRIATELTFGAAVALSPAELDKHWTVGTLFPLPVWATDAANVRTWHVDVDRITAAIGQVAPAPSAELTAVRDAARLLHSYDATTSAAVFKGPAALDAALAVRAGLATLIGGAGFSAATEGTRLAGESRWNPYAVLFRLLETSIALDTNVPAANRPAAVAAFAAAYWADLTGPERAVVGDTSAGHAWFRRLWTWWGRAVPQADLKTALGLGAIDDLAQRAPGMVGELEPPILGVTGLPVPSKALMKTPMPVMALGRQIDFIGVGYPKAAPNLFGVSYAGTVKTGQYLVPKAGVNPPMDPAVIPGATAADKARTQQQYGRILTAIGAAEGELDAGASYDRGICSLGYQQWSMHEPLEGAVLFERLKRNGPVYYDLVVRALGIETGITSVGSPSATGAGPADLDDPSCFYTLSPGAAPVQHVAPGGTSDAAIADVRANVFDWSQAADKSWHTGKRGILMAARWSVAARYGIELWQTQAEAGFHRIARAATYVRSPGESPLWQPVLALPTVPAGTGPNGTARPLELFSTEGLLGLVVDMMVNTPGHLGAAMRRAVLRTLAALQQPVVAGVPVARLPLDDLFAHTLATSFLAERHYFGTNIWVVRNKKRQLDHVDNRRGAEIDVAHERVRLLVGLFGTASSLTSPAVDPALAKLLRDAEIPATPLISVTAPVDWP